MQAAKGVCARTRSWLYRSVRIGHGVKLDRAGFSGRTCGYTLECVIISHREIEESI
jgi:hypothetical protein